MSIEESENNKQNPPPAAIEWKTARELQDENKDDCWRCIRLGRNPRGKISAKGGVFCEFCYEGEMPAHIYRPELYNGEQ